MDLFGPTQPRIIGAKDLHFVFSSQCRFFLRDAQDRLLAPQNDNSHGFFRSL
jgi:hypothetical protein